MKKRVTIGMLLFTVTFVKAQQNCLPAYHNTVKQLPVNDSLQIAYIEQGKGETILFIHGLGGNLSHWEKNVATLSHKFRCIAVDLPGYGYSLTPVSSPSQGQLDLYAEIILSFMDKLHLKEITVAGHSMGAQIAVIAGLKAPAKIKRLVLVSPAGFETFSETESNLLRSVSTPAFFKTQDETAIRASFKKNFYEQPDDVEPLITYRLALKQCESFDGYCQTLVKGIQGMLSHPVKDQLSQLQQKVLIIFGENDELIPNKYLHPKLTTLAVAEEGSGLIKDHQLIMMPQAGHTLQYEKPAELNKILINFLSDIN